VDTNPEEALEAPTVALLANLISNNNGSPLIIVVDTKEASNIKAQEEVTTEEEEAIEVDLQLAAVPSLAANLRKCRTLSLGVKSGSLVNTTN
jgi:hypothetical protein